MILKIVPFTTSDMIKKAYCNVKLMDYKTFNQIEVHPFISSQKWDKVIIILQQGIKSGYISQLLTKDFIIEPLLYKETKVDFEVVKHMCEALPNASSAIRKAFIQKKDIIPLFIEAGGIYE